MAVRKREDQQARWQDGKMARCMILESFNSGDVMMAEESLRR